MRVALVLGSLEIGGAEVLATRLAAALTDRGHEVHVIALSRGGPLTATLEARSIPVTVLGMESIIVRGPRGWPRPIATIRGLAPLWRLVRLFREQRVEVVHTSLLWPSLLALSAAFIARVPRRVSSWHNLGAEFSGQRFRVVERIALMLSHEAIVVSRAVQEVLSSGHRSDRKLRLVHNGVPVAPSAHDVRHQPPCGVMIANLVHYKGHADLLAALAQMSDPPRIDCFGDGPERVSLERLRDALGLTAIVRFRGSQLDASQAYESAQFAVLASHEEGLGIAVLESMAHGLPVVATSVGGIPEVVSDGVTGLLVPPRSPVELAAALTRLVEDPNLRQTLGRSARARVADSFGLDRCVDQHLAVYAGVVRD